MEGRARASRGSYFNFDTSLFFTHDLPDTPLSFSASGFPPGSGIYLDAQTGMLSGFPSQYDAMTQQPLTIHVTTRDQRGKLSKPVAFPVLVSGLAQAVGLPVEWDIIRDAALLTKEWDIVEVINPVPQGVKLDIDTWWIRGIATVDQGLLEQPLRFAIRAVHKENRTRVKVLNHYLDVLSPGQFFVVQNPEAAFVCSAPEVASQNHTASILITTSVFLSISSPL
jgi:hypothetical protein